MGIEHTASGAELYLLRQVEPLPDDVDYLAQNEDEHGVWTLLALSDLEAAWWHDTGASVEPAIPGVYPDATEGACRVIDATTYTVEQEG